MSKTKKKNESSENDPSLEEHVERGPHEETAEVVNVNFVNCYEGTTQLDHLKSVISEKDETIMNLENIIHVKDGESEGKDVKFKELELRLSEANKQLENAGIQIGVCKCSPNTGCDMNRH